MLPVSFCAKMKVMKKSFLIVNIAIGAIFGLVGFFLLLAFSDPKNSVNAVIFLLYASLFIWLCGLLLLAGYLVRKKIKPTVCHHSILAVAFRQAALLSGLLVAVLVCQSWKIFYWWMGLILLLMVLFLEIFLSRKNC